MTALKKVVPNIKKEKAKNLAEMIDRLPTPALSNDGLRELLLQFIVEIPDDNPDAAFGTFAKEPSIDNGDIWFCVETEPGALIAFIKFA